jgi:hypothetical protein
MDDPFPKHRGEAKTGKVLQKYAIRLVPVT